MRRQKYHDIGILKALNELAFGPQDYRIQRRKIMDKLTDQDLIRKDYFNKKVYDLKRRGLIEYTPSQSLILTEKGLKRINFQKLEEITLEEKKIDGLWRLIIFDIPEQKRSARHLLRDKLNELNCYQLQKSVYVTPYICEKEIDEIVRFLGIAENVNIIIAKSLGFAETKIKKHFKI